MGLAGAFAAGTEGLVDALVGAGTADAIAAGTVGAGIVGGAEVGALSGGLIDAATGKPILPGVVEGGLSGGAIGGVGSAITGVGGSALEAGAGEVAAGAGAGALGSALYGQSPTSGALGGAASGALSGVVGALGSGGTAAPGAAGGGVGGPGGGAAGVVGGSGDTSSIPGAPGTTSISPGAQIAATTGLDTTPSVLNSVGGGGVTGDSGSIPGAPGTSPVGADAGLAATSGFPTASSALGGIGGGGNLSPVTDIGGGLGTGTGQTFFAGQAATGTPAATGAQGTGGSGDSGSDGSSLFSSSPTSDAFGPFGINPTAQANASGISGDQAALAANGVSVGGAGTSQSTNGFLSNLTSGNFGDAASQAGSFLKSNAGVLLAGGALGAEGLLSNRSVTSIQGANAVESTANQLASQGKTLESYLQSGTLPPGVQSSLDQASQQAQATIRGQYAARGMSGSSAEATDLANVHQNIAGQGANIALSLLNQGVSESNLASSLYSQIMQTSLAQSQQLSQGLAALAGAAARPTVNLTTANG